jgi:hypothetical protein
MSRGILQLAVSGKLPLQLDYQMLATPLEESRANMESSEDIDPSNTSFMTASFELIYGEY